MFYATEYAEDGHIAEDATICAFETEAEAHAYLREQFDNMSPEEFADFDGNGTAVEIVIEAGDFADCWIRLREQPDTDRLAAVGAPFSPDDLIVIDPHNNPGMGRQWWITPAPIVLTASLRPVRQSQ